MGGKRCSCCRKFKPMDDFSKNKSNKDGYDHMCKPCRVKRSQRTRTEKEKNNEQAM